MPNPFEQELERRKALSARQESRWGRDGVPGNKTAQVAANRFLGNMANAPSAMADLGMRGANFLLQPGLRDIQRLGEIGGAIATGDPSQIQHRGLQGQDFLRGEQLETGVDMAANVGAQTANQIARPVQRAAEGVAALRTGDFNQFAPNPQVIPVPENITDDFVRGPTGDELMGGVQRIGEGAAALVNRDFTQFQPDAAKQQRERIEQIVKEDPRAAFFGNISGDILTLMTGRAPLANARGRAQVLSQRLGQRAASQSGPIALAPNVSSALKNVTANSRSARTLMNRAGRAAETGLEGMVLSALNGQADPMETFGFAAGTQAAGSLLLAGTAGLLSGGPQKAALKLGISAAAIGSAVQLVKSSTPGGRDFILESAETGFNKVALGLAAGMVSGAAGMGRVTGGFPTRALPGIADTITAMPRAATLSVMTEILDDPAAEAVVMRLATNPEYFNATARRQLQRAMDVESVSMSQTIENLMQDEDFRKKFEALE
jgi:hypothetical protein